MNIPWAKRLCILCEGEIESKEHFCVGALLQVFQYLKSTTLLGLSYKRQNHHDLQLQGWCDADYNSDKDTRHSTIMYHIRD